MDNQNEFLAREQRLLLARLHWHAALFCLHTTRYPQIAELLVGVD